MPHLRRQPGRGWVGEMECGEELLNRGVVARCLEQAFATGGLEREYFEGIVKFAHLGHPAAKRAFRECDGLPFLAASLITGLASERELKLLVEEIRERGRGTMEVVADQGGLGDGMTRRNDLGL